MRYALYEANGYFFVGMGVYTADGKPADRPGYLVVLDFGDERGILRASLAHSAPAASGVL